ncbi:MULTISPECIES: hypothetical protein [Paenibacillus]|uniref:Uncharacterized protein n=1 Tax=Paenibacillus naphthalenovorans TaxID=162209 RepID=A0A0U2VQB2_9BACL|nr:MULTISPECIES: hypothetical protein [Paenibacillus]ALS22966.1 hypothetical protein IJ22_25930 [Paenibacillus naphthalenovorans]GCL71973.1 hypothetical protein PN4B1_18780 [Paenibacillus naphthalenovorans]SDI43976.1 acetolactate synthase-1/2/3 large subunit [Paenibacillus naphthalenovorans]
MKKYVRYHPDHQEREYPRRIAGTLLTNPNFAELAQLFGGYGEQIDRHEDFAPAFGRIGIKP